MSGPGQPLPPRLLEAFAAAAANCSPAAPVPGGKTFPFPQPSQAGIVSGAASLNDGFVAANMTALTSGGIPPYGVDMNGILFLISSWAAYLGAGQIPAYDATLQTFMSGYALGARIQQAADNTATWVSIVSGNMTNPDTGGAGWVSSKTLYNNTTSATAGTISNLVLPGPSDYILDYDLTTAGGNVVIAGVVAQRNNQKLTFRKKDSTANVLTIGALVGATGNQLQAVGDLIVGVQYSAYTILFNSTLNAWVPV